MDASKPAPKPDSMMRETGRDLLRDVVAVTEQRDAVLPTLQRTYEQAAASADDRAVRLAAAPRTRGHRERRTRRDAESPNGTLSDPRRAMPLRPFARHRTARTAPRRSARGPRATRSLVSEWRRTCPHADRSRRVVGFAVWFDDTPRHHAHFDSYARRLAEQAHPDYLAARTAAQDAYEAASSASHELHQAERRYSMALAHYGSLGHAENPAKLLAQSSRRWPATRLLRTAREQIVALRTEPTLRTLPAETVELARADWTADRAALGAAREDRMREQRRDQTRDLGWGSRGWGGVSENLDRDRHPGISR